MKRFLSVTAAAIVVGAFWFGTVVPARPVSITVTDSSYALADQFSVTGPTITSKLGINNLALPSVGTLGAKMNFFTLNPTQVLD
jgi:hypothetical protein